MNSNKSLSLGFELLDIEIIDNKKESGTPNEKWNCDECSLFFLSKDKLAEHKNKHSVASEVLIKCRYCNKTLSIKEETKECYANRKCNTCEYKCSKCPLRFQRHSSFVNHEKSHSLLKKKKPVLVKKKPVRGPENQSVSNASKKKHTGDIVTKQQKIVKRRGNDDEHIRAAISPKKRKTLPGVLLNEKPEPLFTKETVQTNDKIKKQCIDSSKTSEEKTIREKQKNKANIPNDSVNNSSHDNTVNYKPFSCHICGENFASGDSLLAHIQSHGENVSKGFKCKHCGDEFDDIYKMQYHLAICPLAEDETVLVKNIPSKFHATPSNGPPRKLGRPKKMKPNNSDNDSDYEVTPSFRTRGSIKKRSKTDESSESASETPDVLSSKSSNYHTRLRINKPYRLEGNSFINEFVDTNSCYKKSYGGNTEEDEKESVNDPLNDSFENLDDDKAKVHSCPFPRCGIKFSREKALLCHMRNHNDDFEDSYKCHKCDIPFDDIQSLRSHLNECKDVKEEKEDDISEPEYTDDDKTDKSFQKKRGNFPCSICGRTYLSEEKLKRHLALHGSSNFICRICKDVFINQSLLDAHFIAKHPQKSSYHCDICNEDFISELFLNIHESEYHGEPTEQFTEPTRASSFDESDSTKSMSLRILKSNSYCSTVTNIRSKSGNKDRFWCAVCFKQFNQTESMRLHFRTDHIISTGSVYVCEICEAEKPNVEMLCFHLEMHSSNLLSVNRFSTLRAYVNGREQKGHEIIPNKSRSKIGFRNHDNSDNKQDFVQVNEIVKVEANVQRRVKLTKNVQRKKIYIKARKGLGRTAGSKTNAIVLRKLHKETASTSRYNSDRLSQPKNVRKNGKCKLNLNTGTRKGKINNRNKKLIGRKQRQLHKNKVKNNQELKNSITRASSPEHTEDKESVINSSDDNSLQENIDTEGFVSINKNPTNKSTKIVKNKMFNKDANNTDDISLGDTKNIKNDSRNDYSEEICCSMCSMVFYHQDELLDHVATHI